MAAMRRRPSMMRLCLLPLTTYLEGADVFFPTCTPTLLCSKIQLFHEYCTCPLSSLFSSPRLFLYWYSQYPGRTTMSAAQNIQNHPVYQQASTKAKFYHSQLDKEVCFIFISFFRTKIHQNASAPSSSPQRSPYRHSAALLTNCI